MLPAWIAAGMQLIGANVANNRAKIERRQAVDDVENQFVRLRAGAEKAGYNPLAVLGTASGIPASTGSSAAYMGQAIADTGLMIADGIANAKSAKTLQKVTALETQNQGLLERLTRQTLRPKIGGVYTQPQTVPTLQQALGQGGQGVSTVQDASGLVDSSGRPVLAFGNVGPLNWNDPGIRSQSDDESRVPQKPLYVLGQALYPTSGTSDAEALGSRYGEDFMSPAWFAGWGAFGTDVGNAFYQSYNSPQAVERRRQKELARQERLRFRKLMEMNADGVGRFADSRYDMRKFGRASGRYTPDIVEKFPYWGLFQDGASLTNPPVKRPFYAKRPNGWNK